MAQEWTLVTGASEGIGKEFARIAASKGRPVILAARSEDKLKALADELEKDHGVETAVIVADLAEPKGAKKLWTAATKGKRRIDFLINNAGLGRNGAFDDAETFGGWEREATSIQVNVVALTELCKLAVPHLKEAERGRILNVASVAGFMPGPGMAVYNATKAYVLNLSQALQAELEDSDVSVTALCPGATESNFFSDAEMKSARVTSIGGKLPTAKEVALEGWNAAIRGQAAHVPGFKNKIAVWTSKLLPAPAVAAIGKYMLERE